MDSLNRKKIFNYLFTIILFAKQFLFLGDFLALKYKKMASNSVEVTTVIQKSQIDKRIKRLIQTLDDAGIQARADELILRSLDEYLLIQRFRRLSLERSRAHVEGSLRGDDVNRWDDHRFPGDRPFSAEPTDHHAPENVREKKVRPSE